MPQSPRSASVRPPPPLPSPPVLLTQPGTWQSAPGEVETAVRHAIRAGYRHIDTAFCYQNEEEVGRGIHGALASGEVQREELFVTTKLWCTYHSRVEEALEASLRNLGLEYLDLFLVHWPLAMNPRGLLISLLYRGWLV